MTWAALTVRDPLYAAYSKEPSYIVTLMLDNRLHRRTTDPVTTESICALASYYYYLLLLLLLFILVVNQGFSESELNHYTSMTSREPH